MKTILHLPCSYLPWVTGGKETFTHALSRELDRMGWVNHVVFHQNPSFQEPLGLHRIDHAQVHVLPPLQIDRFATYACRTQEVPQFEKTLQEINPDVVHFHDFSSGANLHHLEIVKKHHIRCLMTYHSPGQTCLQRELLYEGKTVCDGEIRLDRCTSCRFGVQKIPQLLRWPLSRISLPLSSESKLARAFSARSMTKHFQMAWKQLVSHIDAIHVLAHWCRELMIRNQVPESKLHLLRTGLPFREVSKTVTSPRHRQPHDPLKLLMLGRCERIKGQHVVIDAVQKHLPMEVKVEITFLGPYWNTSEYGRSCQLAIEGDPRFLPIRQVPHADVPNEIHQCDVVLIPSLWLETGPLVALEAFSCGKPILGSRLGGIAELVTDRVNGLLFEPESSTQLAECIKRLVSDPALLVQLQSGVKPPRSMRQLAEELYSSTGLFRAGS